MNSLLSGFSNTARPVSSTSTLGAKAMFAFDRSAIAVLLPLALLVAAVIWSNRTPDAALAARQPVETEAADQTVAANLPSR